MKYSFREDQGGREYMEDTYAYSKYENGYELFCIFDGHGGDEVARFCKNNFPQLLNQCISYEPNDIAVCIRKSIRLLDELIKLLNKPYVGATLVMCLVTPERVWFANVGDSMAIVSDKDYNVTLMSQEHKVENEKERITLAGGLITYWDGVARINGTLNLARSMGDFSLKENGLISEPFIRSVNTKNSLFYIFIASDGIWDVYSPNEINKDIIIMMDNNISQDDLCKHLINKAKMMGSRDNITVCLITMI